MKGFVSGAFGVALSVCLMSGVKAQVVGDIQAIYAAPSNYLYPGPGGTTTLNSLVASDAVAFVFENTTGTAITNGVFNIDVGGDNATADSFNVGTIPANSYVAVVPGYSNDGGSGHTFFAYTGSVRDTSDVGPNADTVPFSFTGLYSGTPVSTGTFTPGDSAGPSNDNVLSHANFLGGPNGNDACNDCFGPKVVAQISLPSIAGVPEPGMVSLLGSVGLTALGLLAHSLKRTR